ncbi:hypothetical protein N7540_013051 [Penicillium herquei]|nr:hypothetical protein N7540_013051 [Penicillium herquei]
MDLRSLITLPLEILFLITNLLAAKDLLNLIKCSRDSKEAFLQHLWKNHYLQAFIWAEKNRHDDIAERAMKFRPLNIDAYRSISENLWVVRRPFLSQAARYGLPKTISLLLEQGVDINKVPHYPVHTALLEALRPVTICDSERPLKTRTIPKPAGYFQVVEILLEKGANLEDKDSNEDTALGLAVQMEEPWVELLLRYNPDLNSRNRCGETPLSVALANDNHPVIKLLLGHGADATALIPCGGSYRSLLAIGSISAKTKKLLISHGASPHRGSLDYLSLSGNAPRASDIYTFSLRRSVGERD